MNRAALRLSNIVKSKTGVYLIVKEIMASGITYDRLDGTAVVQHAEWGEIAPVVLWPEILIQCGFYRKGESRVFRITVDYADTGYPCELMQTGDGFQICRSGIGAVTAPVEYLHQLQNLYFTLTGEELKVNL